MRIISNFKDYYDNTIKSLGHEFIDPKLVYVRETKEDLIDKEDIEKKKTFQLLANRACYHYATGKYTKIKSLHNNDFNVEIDVSVIAIGFCGKLYHCYDVDISNFHLMKIKKLYSFVDICNYFRKDGAFVLDLFKTIKNERVEIKNVEEIVEKYQRSICKKVEELESVKYYYSYLSRSGLSIQELDKMNGQTISDEMFISIGAPIVICYNNFSKQRIEINPNLSKYNFAAKVDPFTAFQEISMYCTLETIWQNKLIQLLILQMK